MNRPGVQGPPGGEAGSCKRFLRRTTGPPPLAGEDILPLPSSGRQGEGADAEEAGKR